MRYNIWKQFFKTKINVISTILFFLLSWGFFTFLCFCERTGFLQLYVMARFNFYFCFAWACISFFFMTNANRNNVKEIFELNHKPALFEKNAFGLISLLMIIWNLGAIIILLISSFKNDETNYFITWFPPNFICNVFLPQFIAILITFVVAASKNPTKWFPLEIGFLFMISPLSEIIIWERKPLIPIDSFWNIFKRPFEILYQNGDWSPNTQYNLQTEPTRILTLFFWITLLAAISLYSVFYRKKMGYILGIIALSLLILLELPSSLFRMNLKWNGPNQEMNIYMQESEMVYSPEKEIPYSIEKYNLSIDLETSLFVSGEISITSEYPLDEYVFTLYRGYKVKKIETQIPDLHLEYKQIKDQIYIKTDHEVTELKINIQYSGYHNRFYANSDACMLPGWFPWYPMAGNKQIYLMYSDYGNMHGYNPYNRISPAEIHLQCNKKIISNIYNTSGNIYEGVSDSITLLHGNLLETTDKTVLNYLPFELYKGFSAEDFVRKQKEDYHKAVNILKEQYNIDTFFLEKKKILVTSEDLGRNLTNNQIAFFDDYILTSPNNINANNIFHYLLLQDWKHCKQRENSELIQFCSFNLYFYENLEDTIIHFDSNIVYQLEYQLDIQDNSKQTDMLKDLHRIMQDCNQEMIIQEIVQYMLNPDKYHDDNSFFEYVRETYDRNN